MSLVSDEGPQHEALRQWVCQTLSGPEYSEAPLRLEDVTWQGIPGDAGFRQYFRLNNCNGLLAVYAPPATENNHAFVRVANFLREHSVHVPKVVAHDVSQGFLLVEDLGSALYCDLLDKDSAELFYGEALMELLRLQQCPKDTTVFNTYSADMLRAEMQLFCDWFVCELLGHTLTEQETSDIQNMFNVLIASAQEQPQVVVHRDYHSRNIIQCDDGSIGIIDFQDAVLGPITYDLVSLLKDCYIEWPQEDVKRWVMAYAQMASDVDVLECTADQTIDGATFIRWFDWMGLQRHIKVLGIFARLSLRDGKHGYLNDLPLVLRYVQNMFSQYPEFAAVSAWFDKALMPLVNKQPWAVIDEGVTP